MRQRRCNPNARWAKRYLRSTFTIKLESQDRRGVLFVQHRRSLMKQEEKEERKEEIIKEKKKEISRWWQV
uniref:Uncharacterized protein n=1 Tax=Vespula pensylvanica TaxID=30213 RepID=A0A834JPD9_VESPE|nr:hypothetical protein H0235_017626 [Vespula pensylvanica]